MKRILSALELIYSQIIKTGEFSSTNLKSSMESVFESEGYRENFDEPRNILIIHDGGVGDLMMCSPAIKAIRNNFPNAKITLVVYPRGKDLIDECPYVDQIIYNERKFDWRHLDELLRWDIDFADKLLPNRFDVAFCFCLYVSGILLAYMSGAKKIVGFENDILCRVTLFDYRYLLPLVNFQCSSNFVGTHQVDMYLALVEKFLDKIIVDRDLEIWITEEDIQTAKQLLSKSDLSNDVLISISMGGTGNRKKYPPEKYARLAQKIFEEIPNAQFIILGGSVDAESSKIFMDRFDSDRVLDLTGQINFRVSAAILSMTSMYLGNDTSTMHIASAVEIPCLTPNCFPARKKMNARDIPIIARPYRVPSIIVQPEKPLSECVDVEDEFGCHLMNQTHCISQITVEKMFEGFLLLREKINRNDFTTTYIY